MTHIVHSKHSISGIERVASVLSSTPNPEQIAWPDLRRVTKDAMKPLAEALLDAFRAPVDAMEHRVADIDINVKELMGEVQRFTTGASLSASSTPLPSDVPYAQLENALRISTKHKYFNSTLQAEMVSLGLRNQDLLIVAATGSGKTLGYLLPTVNALNPLGLTTIVVVPLIAIRDNLIRDYSHWHGTKIGTWHAGMTTADRATAIVVVIDTFLKEEFIQFAQELVVLRLLSRVIYDEAYTIAVDDGWRESLRSAGRGRLIDAPITLVSATMTADVLAKIQRTLHIHRAPNTITLSTRRPELRYSVQYLDFHGPPKGQMNCHSHLVKTLQTFHDILLPEERMIVYVWSKAYGKLLQEDLPGWDFYSADLDQNTLERTAIETRWHSGSRQALLATPAFGSGIHKNEVRGVIHIGYPSNMFDWMQQTGRAGRDHCPSEAIMLLPQDPTWILGRLPDDDLGGAEYMIRSLQDPNRCIRSIIDGFFTANSNGCAGSPADVLRCDRCMPLEQYARPPPSSTAPPSTAPSPAGLRLPSTPHPPRTTATDRELALARPDGPVRYFTLPVAREYTDMAGRPHTELVSPLQLHPYFDDMPSAPGPSTRSQPTRRQGQNARSTTSWAPRPPGRSTVEPSPHPVTHPSNHISNSSTRQATQQDLDAKSRLTLIFPALKRFKHQSCLACSIETQTLSPPHPPLQLCPYWQQDYTDHIFAIQRTWKPRGGPFIDLPHGTCWKCYLPLKPLHGPVCEAFTGPTADTVVPTALYGYARHRDWLEGDLNTTWANDTSFYRWAAQAVGGHFAGWINIVMAAESVLRRTPNYSQLH